MDLITLLIWMVIALVVAGAFLYCVSIIPNIPPIIKVMAQIIIVLIALVLFLNGVGFVHVGGLHVR